MSRKTRKLMWSVPLIAAVAVIGALAAFMTLQPGDASEAQSDGHSRHGQKPASIGAWHTTGTTPQDRTRG